METTIGNSIQQLSSYTDRTAAQKKSTDKSGPLAQGTKTARSQADPTDTAKEKTDTVEITNARLIVSKSNQTAAETDIEDIDEIARKIQELKELIQDPSEFSKIEQVHNLNVTNLAEVLS